MSIRVWSNTGNDTQPSGPRSHISMKPQAAQPGTTSSLEGYLEAQRWIQRSIERCECPVTTRFLERINAGIESRLTELREPPNVGS